MEEQLACQIVEKLREKIKWIKPVEYTEIIPTIMLSIFSSLHLSEKFLSLHRET